MNFCLGPFALVAAARLRCCCNLRKSKGRLRPTQKQMRGKQMEAQKRPLLLAIATQRQKGKGKGRGRSKCGLTQKRGTRSRASAQMSIPLLVSPGEPLLLRCGPRLCNSSTSNAQLYVHNS